MPARLRSPLALACLLVAGLTVARVAVLFATPLELYPDEAQYWLWSRELAWGYYSKPPMVAWLIAASTGIGGQAEAWIRVSAPLTHAAAALALYGAGARLYGGWTGFWAVVLYSLMPAVQLSSGLMTTDAPLLMFLSLALWSYAVLWRSEADPTRRLAAAGVGLFLGLAFLSKYAAVYFLVGIVVHAAASREVRRRWSWPGLALAGAAFALVIAPNLAWNAAHGFSTVSHTAANANWAEAERFNPGELADFVFAQLGVFGPLPLLVLLLGAARLLLRRGGPDADLALLGFILPPLLIVTAQAFISRANANWAAAAYAPASVLVAAWLVRRRARALLGATVALQGALAAVFLLCVARPSVADQLGLANSVKRVRGWAAITRAVEREIAAGGWSAVAVDDRFLFNALAYYGREAFARADAPPLVMWVREATPQNQAETERPLRPEQAQRLLVVSLIEVYRGEIAGDFRLWRPLRRIEVRLDAERSRAVSLFAASGYVRGPRDPRTGLPLRGAAVRGAAVSARPKPP